MNNSHCRLVSLALLVGASVCVAALAPGCGSSDDQANADAGSVVGSDNDAATLPGPGPGGDGGVEPGSSSGGSGQLPPGSGSRLRRVTVGPAGAPDAQFVGFHDTTLDIDCAPVRIGEELRCTPPIAPSGANLRRVFADAACTQQVVAPTALPCSNSHWIVRGSAADGGDRIAPIVLPALEGVVQLFEQSAQNGACVVSQAQVGTTSLYALGAPRPATDYARAQAITYEADGIASSTVVSDDGARWPATYRQASANLACAPWPDRDGAIRCLPGNFAMVVGFWDGACTVPKLGAFDAKATQDDTVLRVLEPGTCPPRAHLLSVVGGSDYSKTFSLDAAGVCDPRGAYLFGSLRTFKGAGEIEPSALGAFAEAAIPAGARLTAVVHSRGADRATSYYADAQRAGALCRFATASDGVQRCLPFEPVMPVTTLEQATEMAFADAECTQPIRIVLRTDAALSCSVPNALVATDASTCPPVSTVYALGEERSQETTFSKVGVRCAPLREYGIVRVVGEPILPTEFEAGTQVTE